MIVVQLSNGDCAEAETVESAFAAARCLWDEADLRSTRPCVRFETPDGELLLSTTKRTELGHRGF